MTSTTPSEFSGTHLLNAESHEDSRVFASQDRALQLAAELASRNAELMRRLA